jgi:hypothetical protein
MISGRGQGVMERVGVMAMAALVFIAVTGMSRAATAAAATLGTAGGVMSMPDRGDRPSDQDGATPGVFAPGPGQEYELAFFIAAAVLTVLVAGAFIVVIVVHGRGSHASDVEAAPEDIEA